MDADKPALSEPARAALAAGNLLEAIRIVREDSGLGLKAAKDRVDRYLAEHAGTRQRFQNLVATERARWRSLILAALVAAALAWLALRG